MVKASKSVVKYILRFAESFVAFLFVYLIIVILGQSIHVGETNPSGEVTLYVCSNGVHTDVCLPTKSVSYDWETFVPRNHFPENDYFEYIRIGWGDKGFFMDTPTWGDLTFSTAFSAAFLPSETAMHVAYVKRPTMSANSVEVTISKASYLKLIKYIQLSFNLKHSKPDLIYGEGYSKNDNFYEANGSYHLFRTCNTWTNAALKTANIRTSFYALFQGGIMLPLNK